jgi:transcriptional regulator PpsR
MDIAYREACRMSGVNIAESDITLVLNMDGVIQDVTLSPAIGETDVESLRGRAWADTVADMGGGKIARIVEDAKRTGVSAFRHVNQRFPSGREMPMEYTTIRVGGRNGLLAIGRSLQAVAELQSRLISVQQAMEQDYWKLREIETRYRLLFDASTEAVLLLKVDDLRITEANRAAVRALALNRGADLLMEIAPADQEAFQGMLVRAREHGRAPGIVVHIGAGQEPWVVRASLMAADVGQTYLLQLAPVDRPLPAQGKTDPMSLDSFAEYLPDALVVIDRDGVVRRVNRAFVDLTQAGAEGGVIGESLGRWLSQPGADLGVLLSNLGRHGAVRLFATRFHGDLGSETDVEISAVRNPEAQGSVSALLIRDIGRRLPEPAERKTLHTALSSLIGQPGDLRQGTGGGRKTSLLTLVDEAVEMVERHYIEAALTMADGNRTAAAELLGLSRQSLYKKLARYELDGTTDTQE